MGTYKCFLVENLLWNSFYGCRIAGEVLEGGKLLENLHNKMSKHLSRYNSRIDSIFLFFFLSYLVNFKNFKNFVRRKQRVKVVNASIKFFQYSFDESRRYVAARATVSLGRWRRHRQVITGLDSLIELQGRKLGRIQRKRERKKA